jgi:hypothetical protein
MVKKNLTESKPEGLFLPASVLQHLVLGSVSVGTLVGMKPPFYWAKGDGLPGDKGKVPIGSGP